MTILAEAGQEVDGGHARGNPGLYDVVRPARPDEYVELVRRPKLCVEPAAPGTMGVVQGLREWPEGRYLGEPRVETRRRHSQESGEPPAVRNGSRIPQLSDGFGDPRVAGRLPCHDDGRRPAGLGLRAGGRLRRLGLEMGPPDDEPMDRPSALPLHLVEYDAM